MHTKLPQQRSSQLINLNNRAQLMLLQAVAIHIQRISYNIDNMSINKTRKPKTAPKLKQPYVSPVNGEVIQLTDNQHQFTDAVLTAKDSDTLINRVMEIYETDRQSARVIARQNFTKPNIELYLGDRGYKAIDVMYQIMTSNNVDSKSPDDTRLAAAKEIADRQFGKARQQVDIQSTSVNISLDLTGLAE